jgi:hypothetical protein
MKNTMLAGAAVLALAAGTMGGAQAQCVWNGYNWNCGGPQAYAPAQQPYPGYYPQPANGSTSNPEITGYKPAWVPSQIGPKASSGSAR